MNAIILRAGYANATYTFKGKTIRLPVAMAKLAMPPHTVTFIGLGAMWIRQTALPAAVGSQYFDADPSGQS